MIIGITFILIAIILAIAFEKAMNSVLPPEMVKDLLNNETLNKELSSLLNDDNIAKDVQSIIYDQDQLKKNLEQEESNNVAANKSKLATDRSLSTDNGIKGNTDNQDFKRQEVSNNTSSHDSSQSSLNKNSPKGENQTSSSQAQHKLNISTADQLEAAKIVFSVMSMAEIKELVSLYRSGKKTEAIQRGIGILRQRLTVEQKKKLWEIYSRSIK